MIYETGTTRMKSWNFWTNYQKINKLCLKSWVYWARLSTHPYMMQICWSIDYFPSFSSALLPFLLLKTRLPGLATEFPFLSPSLPSHLHQKQTCHHNPCVYTTSGTLYYHGPCMFPPVIYGVIHIPLTEYCQMLKTEHV